MSCVTTSGETGQRGNLGNGATVGYPPNTCGRRPAPPADGEEESNELRTAHRSAVGLTTPPPAPSPKRRGGERQGLLPLSLQGRGRGEGFSRRPLIPTDEDAAEPVHPTMCPLHYPPPRLVPGFLLERLRLLAARPDMGREPELRQQFPHLVVVVPLVQAQVLRAPARTERGFWPFPSTFCRYGVDYSPAIARRASDGGSRRDLFPLACRGSDRGGLPHSRATHAPAGGLPLPPGPGHRLLLDATAQSLPPAL